MSYMIIAMVIGIFVAGALILTDKKDSMINSDPWAEDWN